MTAIVAIAALAATAMACSSDDDDDTTPVATTGASSDADIADVEDTIKQAFADWNAKDLEKFTAHFTDAGLVSSFGDDIEVATATDVKAALAEFIGVDLLSDPTFNETIVDGTSATSDVQFSVGTGLDHAKFTFTKVGDEWKLNEEESLTVAIPAGYTTVHVDLNEFAFALDTAEISDATGKVALEASNVGKQQHEIGLARIPADVTIADILAADGELPGIEFITGAGPIEPGEGDNLVLGEPLEPGRYMLVCSLPDTAEGPDGPSHASKGMIKDFVIE